MPNRELSSDDSHIVWFCMRERSKSFVVAGGNNHTNHNNDNNLHTHTQDGYEHKVKIKNFKKEKKTSVPLGEVGYIVELLFC